MLDYSRSCEQIGVWGKEKKKKREFMLLCQLNNNENTRSIPIGVAPCKWSVMLLIPQALKVDASSFDTTDLAHFFPNRSHILSRQYVYGLAGDGPLAGGGGQLALPPASNTGPTLIDGKCTLVG